MALQKSGSAAGDKTSEKAKVAAKVAVVRAEGDVDRAGIEACDYMLSRAGDDIEGAVVDLSQATHLDYKAAVILVARRRVLKAKGLELAVAASLRDVRHILRAAVGQELPIFPTVEEARAYVTGEADFALAGAGSRRSQAR